MTDEQPLSRRAAREAREAAGNPAAADAGAPAASPTAPADGLTSVPGLPNLPGVSSSQPGVPMQQEPTAVFPGADLSQPPIGAPAAFTAAEPVQPPVAFPAPAVTPSADSFLPTEVFSAPELIQPADPFQPTEVFPAPLPQAAAQQTAQPAPQATVPFPASLAASEAPTVVAPAAPTEPGEPGAAGDGGAGGDEPPAGGGIGALLRKYPKAWLITAAALGFVLLGTASVFAGVAFASNDASAAPAPKPTVTEEPPRPVSTLEATASRLRTCSVAGPAADGRLATLYGSVMRADTGEVLFDRSAATPAPTASVLKLLTASAAISSLGPDFRITTSVYEGSSPGTIVLVGRGDATLSVLPAGQESIYLGAPKLQTLAESVVANYAAKYPDVPITKVVLDASYWNPGDAWDPTWRDDQRTRGYQSLVTALQVDGDRDDPRGEFSPRGTDPISRAGQAFVDALYDADPSGDVVGEDITTSTGTAIGTVALAEVQSQPVRTLVAYMLLESDNTLAEMLARIVSKEGGQGGTAASLQTAITGQLGRWGISPTGIVIKDGSGLSPQNVVPASTVSSLLRVIYSSVDNLDAVRDGLSVAGQSGTLKDRYGGDNAIGRGNVKAKSGMIVGSYTLAGELTAADGTPLVFTFYAVGEGVAAEARTAIDTLTVAVLRCGDNLSNY